MKAAALAVAGALMAASVGARGQSITVSPPVAVFQGSATVAYAEPSIAASTFNADQAVVVCNKLVNGTVDVA